MSAAAGRKIRIVVVDDSALIRSLLTTIINEAPDMEVVATASDPIVARERIRETSPDMITLDVEMPRMDGLEFLRRLMRLRPTPVLMISSLTQSGSETTLSALELGAVDFLPKPTLDVSNTMQSYADDIRDKIRMVAAARLRRPSLFAPSAAAAPARVAPALLRQNAIIAVGASTGGTDAIKEFLEKLPAGSPPVLIVQHMPEGFTLSFARRLDKLCAIQVKEAEDGEPLLRGVAYVAPGHSHMRLGKGTQGFVICLDQSPPVNRHRPSVDVLFASVAALAAAQTVAVIMTGMGKDGALGMLQLRQAGATTFAQDEASCVVYGMPREAVAQGGVMHVHPLSQLADKVMDCLRLPHDRATP
ncbi:protein-glutamate methylesterase/protein-glutamine glutaminase [Aquitalea aquatica]|uniref:Protein-glutamate methylesterase/protein-glutamine glutaminase n=1 Tax=Aquitalea aquatica TaxID=3044273 RepID=A0A838YAV8_9NEIS|nr:chemotaxis response regulator protein-glutamate methylesterase [Aquitalea magnusonii]MBA4707904.1 chemotaxis response regulator protein-glutamate methylesterase [Aquitalea magnusonii]